MLKAPNWCPDAKPSLRGWHHPHSGEVLASANHTKHEVNEWHTHHSTAVHSPAPVPVAPMHHNPQTLNEAPSVERTLSTSEETHYGFHTEQ